MSEKLVGKLWSWSVHSGDPLFAEAAAEIERLRNEIASLRPKVFNNVEELLSDLDQVRELDIVDELEFFAEASNSKEVVVTMLSGEVFSEAANEILYLRELVEQPPMTKEELVLAQKACSILYWYARDDYLNVYPERQYDKEICEAQKAAAVIYKQVRKAINMYYYL